MRTLSLHCLLMLAIFLAGCGGSDAPSETETPETSTGAESESSAEASNSTNEEMAPAESEADAAASAESTNTTVGETTVAADSTLRFIPENAVLAYLARPAKSLGNPIVKQLMKSMEGIDARDNPINGLNQAEQQLGIQAEQIDHVLVAINSEFMEAAPMLMMGPPSGSAMPVVAVKLAEGADAQTILDNLPPGGDPVEVAGKPGITSPDGIGVLLKIDDSTLLFTSPDTAEAAMNNSAGGKVQAMLANNAASDTALAIDLGPVKEFLNGMLAENPNPAIGMVMPMVTQMQTLSLAADLEASDLLKLSVSTPNADAAAGVQAMLQQYLGLGKQQFEQIKGEIPPGLQAMASEVVTNAAISTADSTVNFVIARPANFEKLPELMKPLMEQAKVAAGAAAEKNNLKQLGLAFHNYHAVYNHFPALDANGEEDEDNVRGKGLSWRVHLLPYIDESALYNQFNMDEAWDSKHNKALIAQMPEVFGSDPEGKTSIHVFAGDGLLFAKDEPGPRLRDITDGTSNTILAVQAGEDAADIWTKPGGLELNADDPVKPLGEIGDTFLALLCDGSVKSISKSIDMSTLLFLLQPSDGNPVPQF